MTLVDFYDIVQNANEIDRLASQMVRQVGYLCRNRLRDSGVDKKTLSILKRELRNWDAVRDRWK